MPVRQPQYFQAVGPEDLIEGGGELAVAVAEQELGLHGADVLERRRQALAKARAVRQDRRGKAGE